MQRNLRARYAKYVTLKLCSHSSHTESLLKQEGVNLHKQHGEVMRAGDLLGPQATQAWLV